MKKKQWLALLLCALLTLTGCTSSTIRLTGSGTDVKLPDAVIESAAPVGDAGLSVTRDTLIYVPSHDEVSLTGITASITYTSAKPYAESIVRAMLNYTGSGSAASLGDGVRLSLSGSHPVEVSRDSVTINLGASALRLDRSRLYLIGQAFADTLTQLDGIEYVNLLVAGKPVGMDVANTLPMGALARSAAKNINGVYEQLLTHRVGTDEAAEDKPFVANVTLYYPLQGMDALVCGTQSISFDSQSMSEIVSRILSQLALGLPEAEEDGIYSPELPLLGDLLTAVPVISESEEAGGSILVLCFAQNLEDMLDAYGVSREAEMASLCKTFCSFLPGLVGIQVTVEGAPVDALPAQEEQELGESRGEIWLRKESPVPLYDSCTLYFANDHGGLTAVQRPVPYSETTNARSLLLELARGPQPEDSVQGLTAVMGGEALTDTMIIGMELQSNTMLVNFSPAFVNVGNGMSAPEERLMAYAMVNTLCSNSTASAVCFFRSGKQFEGFSGEICWTGLFYPIPAEPASKPEAE